MAMSAIRMYCLHAYVGLVHYNDGPSTRPSTPMYSAICYLHFILCRSHCSSRCGIKWSNKLSALLTIPLNVTADMCDKSNAIGWMWRDEEMANMADVHEWAIHEIMSYAYCSMYYFVFITLRNDTSDALTNMYKSVNIPIIRSIEEKSLCT